jgi:hypothetical protein
MGMVMDTIVKRSHNWFKFGSVNIFRSNRQDSIDLKNMVKEPCYN